MNLKANAKLWDQGLQSCRESETVEKNNSLEAFVEVEVEFDLDRS